MLIQVQWGDHCSRAALRSHGPVFFSMSSMTKRLATKKALSSPTCPRPCGEPDGLTDPKGMAGLHRNWRAMPRHGLQAGDNSPEEEAAIEARIRTGRPLGDEGFVDALEAASGRLLKPLRRGPKLRS